jgi:hypothetical protein
LILTLNEVIASLMALLNLIDSKILDHYNILLHTSEHLLVLFTLRIAIRVVNDRLTLLEVLIYHPFKIDNHMHETISSNLSEFLILIFANIHTELLAIELAVSDTS